MNQERSALKKILEKQLEKLFENLLITLKLRSIQSIITLSFTSVTILAMGFVGFTLYNKFSATAEKNASISTQQIVNQVNINLEYYLKSMTEISNLIAYNLSNSFSNERDRLKNLLEVTLSARNDIVTLGIFSSKGELIAGAPLFHIKENIEIEEQSWFKNAVTHPDKLIFSPPHVQNMFRGRKRWVVSLSRETNASINGRQFNAVILVDMSFRIIDELCRSVSLGKRGYIYVVDDYGNIVYHPQQQLIYAGLKNENIEEVLERSEGSYIEDFNGEKRLITLKNVKYADWRIVGVSYMDEIMTPKKEINSFAVFVLIFGMVFAIAASMLISAKISHPIKKLEKLMQKVERGEFDINVEVKGEDEVKQLSRTFNIMILRIKELMSQIIKEQEEKRKSELKALQAQINPHFLYNTLDSIVWMAENGKSQGVITMVTALAKLFRTSISKGEEVITVRDEIEHARNYLIIQQIRFRDKFEFEIKAQPEVLECKSLKLILQPLIENSIYHGFEHMVDKGKIQIIASEVNGKLLYEVIDNGLGMSEEVLERVLKNETVSENGSGVGVKNIHERIKLYYGDEYGLEIESELEEGTSVKVWLPADISENWGETIEKVV